MQEHEENQEDSQDRSGEVLRGENNDAHVKDVVPGADDDVEESNAADTFGSKVATMMNAILQETQTSLEFLLPSISEVESNALDISEDLVRTRELALQRKKMLEEERDRVQEAAKQVLDVLLNFQA